MIEALESELDALLAPMPEDGDLEGAELKRFGELVWAIIAAQAEGDER